MDGETDRQLEILNQQIKELAGIYHQAASGFGVPDNEFWVWYTLIVMGSGHTQQDICDIWSLPKQTVNSVVANLVKKNYVFLEMVPGTHNRKIICLTESGRKYGEATVKHIFEAEHRAFAKMSGEERQACTLLLGKYICALREELDGEAAAE